MAANIRHSSENSEFLTPQWLTDWSHYVLGITHGVGGIDLDPASSLQANRTVRAKRIFTKADNGLFQDWHGNVFLNPPGGLVDEAGREVIRKTKKRQGCTESGACGLPPGHTHSGVESSAVVWWHKLMHEFVKKDGVEKAVFLGFSLEILQSAQTFNSYQPLHFPCSIPKQRIRFETEDENGIRHQGEQPTHGNIIVLVHKRDLMYANPQFESVNRFRDTFSQIGYVHVPRGY